MKRLWILIIILLVITLLAFASVNAHHRPAHCARTPRNPHCVPPLSGGVPTPTLAVRVRPTQPLASACYLGSRYCG